MNTCTIKKPHPSGWGFLYGYEASFNGPSGYEADERSSLGKRPDRRRGRSKGGERSAAVDKIEGQRKPEDFIGHRKPGCRTDERQPTIQAQIESCLRNHIECS